MWKFLLLLSLCGLVVAKNIDQKGDIEIKT